MSSDYFNRAGEPINEDEWMRLYRDRRYTQVARTQLAGAFVSTVWLGLDHGWDPDGPVQIFETMVFDEGVLANVEGWEDKYCERYPTEAAALVGHERIVEALTLRGLERA